MRPILDLPKYDLHCYILYVFEFLTKRIMKMEENIIRF